MTASAPERATTTASRRALLAGALGGIGAWAASAIGRADPVRAEGEVIHVGEEILTATSVTSLTNSANSADVFYASSTGGGAGLYGSSDSFIGVAGTSNSWIGVRGVSTSYRAVFGTSTLGHGVFGYSSSSARAASIGQSGGESTGVEGYSGDGTPPAARPKTGVYGYAAQDSHSKGIFGESPSGWAGFFLGKLYTSKFHELQEMSTPPAPGSNKGRLFMRDNGAGKTQLCVRFSSGAVQVLATQP